MTLRLPAWGSYRTGFYPAYDFKAIGSAAHEKAQYAARHDSDRTPPRDQPSLEICSSVTTRSTFSVLLLMR